MEEWCRGYKGRIKNVTDREVRIELEAQARTVTVRRDQIPPEDGGAPMPRPAPAFGMGSATPAHAGMRTPAYPSATPSHPSMTPSHPGESPRLEVGAQPGHHVLVIVHQQSLILSALQLIQSCK